MTRSTPPAPTPHTPGLVAGMSDVEYHADPSLSSSGARTIVAKSPAHFRAELDHPRTSPAFDIGTAVHTLVLGVGAEVAVLDYPDRRTRTARDAEEAARAAGLVPVLAREYEPVRAMAEAVLAHPRARELLEAEGRAELSAFAVDPGYGVPLRARADRYTGRFIDLKTTDSVSAHDFQRTIEKYRYDVQWAFYDHVFRILGESPEPAISMITVEKKSPHFVATHDLSQGYLLTGRATVVQAIEAFAECVENDDWPSPKNSLIGPSAWFESRIFEEER